MNSLLGGTWGSEERISLPTSTNSPFKVQIKVDLIGFHIFLNGNKTANHIFKHRESFDFFTKVDCKNYTAALEINIVTPPEVKDNVFYKPIILPEEERKVQGKSIYMLISTTISMFAAMMYALEPKQKNIALLELSRSLLEIFASLVNTESSILPADDGNLWRPFTNMLPGSPLSIATLKVEKIVSQHLEELISNNKDEISSEARDGGSAAVSFLLCMAIFRNSLPGLLQVVEGFLRSSWLYFDREALPFWNLLTGKEEFDAQSKFDNSIFAMEILNSIVKKSSEDNRIFSMNSFTDAEKLVKWISIFGLVKSADESAWSTSAVNRANEICALSAKILTSNVSQVLPSVPLDKRSTILGYLAADLKSSVDQMIVDPSRNPIEGSF
jgi:hypothetical protein